MALLLYRAAFGPPLPEPLRPSWFILLVPPSLIYANGVALYPGAFFLENLYFFALVLGVALLVYARGFARWPFARRLVGLHLPARRAGLRGRALRAGAPDASVARRRGATLLLATFFVLAVLWRTLRSGASPRA